MIQAAVSVPTHEKSPSASWRMGFNDINLLLYTSTAPSTKTVVLLFSTSTKPLLMV